MQIGGLYAKALGWSFTFLPKRLLWHFKKKRTCHLTTIWWLWCVTGSPSTPQFGMLIAWKQFGSFFLYIGLWPGLRWVIIQILEFSINHIFFLFQECFYLQIQGTAMGESCAPWYANFFLGWWERKIFLTDPIPLSKKVLSWYRYIDNVIMIWQWRIGEVYGLVEW